jgi:hypothetical protein
VKSDGDFIAKRKLMRPALADGAVAVGEFDAIGAIAHDFHHPGGCADFVGMTGFDGIHMMDRMRFPSPKIILILLILSNSPSEKA